MQWQLQELLEMLTHKFLPQGAYLMALRRGEVSGIGTDAAVPSDALKD